MIKLIHGDCLERMDQLIEEGVIFDSIITDPPYGKISCKWDSVIPFEPMWERLNKLIKPNGAIVLFGSEPFSSALRMSNIKNYKYDWVWIKSMPTGMAQSSYMPMKYHETISIFVNKGKPTYNKQMANRSENSIKRCIYKLAGSSNSSNHVKIGKQEAKQYDPMKVNPKSYIKIKSVPNTPKGSKLHPTQKPVALLEYLIKTYTQENELILDFTMGSGTTGIACKNLNRKFIGIEKEKKYFDIAKERIENISRLF